MTFDPLVPRLGGLPISNARYFRSAHVTEAFSTSASSGALKPSWRIAQMDDPTAPFGSNPITAMAFHPGDGRLAVAVEGAIKFASVSSERVTARPEAESLSIEEGEGPVKPIRQLSFDRVGNQLLACSTDGTMTIWTDLATRLTAASKGRVANTAVGAYFYGNNPLTPRLPEQAQNIRLFATDPDGKTVVYLTNDGAIASGLSTGSAFIKSTDIRTGGAIALAVHPQAPQIYVAFGSGALEVYDSALRPQADQRLELGSPALSLAVSPDGDRLVAGHQDGSLTVLFDASHTVSQPLIPPPAAEATGHARPAEGVLLVHEQAWFMRGIARGELLHGTSLAPGEITQLAVTANTGNVLQNSADAVADHDDLNQTSTGTTEQSDVDAAQASQSTVGVSTGSSSSSATQDAGGIGFVSGASANNSTSALTAGFSSGKRKVADASNQALHQKAHDQAAQNRQRYSAAVREVGEHESHELQTRVVANYNHMHALNLQFYEAVQLMSLQTRVVDAQRMLFVPVVAVEFSDVVATKAMLQRFPQAVADLLAAEGEREAAICVRYLFGDHSSLALRQQRIETLWADVEHARTDLAEANLEAARARSTLESKIEATLAARDALREAENPGFLDKHSLKTTLEEARDAQARAQADVVHRAAEAAGALQRHHELVRRQAAIKLYIGIAREDAAEEAPPSGPAHADAAGASVPLLTDAILEAVLRDVSDALTRHRLAVNQGLWLRISPHDWAGILQGRTLNGRSIAREVDPTPIAVAGHMVGFRWHHQDLTDELEFRAGHLSDADALESTVPLPTGGVFGEAVLGAANVADRIDITRFWKWSDALPPIRPTEIAPIGATDQSDLPGISAPDAPSSTINLGPITFPQSDSALPAVASAVANPDLFKTPSPSAAAALATSALQLSSSGASGVAAENLQRVLQFQEKALEHHLAEKTKQEQLEQLKTVDPTMAGAALNAAAVAGSEGEGSRSFRKADGAAGEEVTVELVRNDYDDRPSTDGPDGGDVGVSDGQDRTGGAGGSGVDPASEGENQ